ncbi:MAG: hypothetical protein FJX47_11450 [Alphaproteobacteria bacterium]|nr:hypothetical protein [Alphaproteobacteria bacterium]
MPPDDDVIVEFQRVGAFVKVSAMDPRTLTEVSIVGSPSATQQELTRLVLRKLDYVLAKKAPG